MREVINNIQITVEKTEEKENGSIYQVKLKIPASYGFIDNVNFITESFNKNNVHKLDFIKYENDYVYFSKNIFLETSAIYHFFFSYEANNDYRIIKKKNIVDPNTIIDEEKWKLSVNFKTPDWAKGKLMYHIFVDRFNKVYNPNFKPMERRTQYKSFDDKMLVGPNKDGLWNVDFYGGNLRGIIDKLDYLKSLGISIIYLSPVVESQSNHRYDTADYERVDPYLGRNNDLKDLCNKAHAKGMKVVLDAVFNHTGNDSKYFNEYNRYKNIGAYQSRRSPYYDFYRHYEEGDNTYFDYWWGMKNLPVCNGYSKKWQDYIYGKGGVIDKWFSLGIDGLRLDVADELSDEFIEGIRKAVKRNKEDGFILGEVWKNPFRMNRGYISSGKGMDSVMNYHLTDALIRYFKYEDVEKLKYILKDIENEYPKETIETLMNFTSTHDISRAMNIFGTDEFQKYGEWAWNPNNDNLDYLKNRKLSKEEYKRGKEIYKSYIYALTFMPGILSIFYGDEIGMEGLGNLANRKAFTWNKKDEELLKFFQDIGRIRNKERFLEKADMNIIDINNRFLLFEREKDNEKALVAVNRTDDTIKTPITEEYLNSDYAYSLNKSSSDHINPHGGYVLKKVKK